MSRRGIYPLLMLLTIFYSCFSNRNRIHSQRNLQSQTVAPTVNTPPLPTEVTRPVQIENAPTDIIRINNAATQTNSSAVNTHEPTITNFEPVPPTNNSANTTNNPSFLLTPLHDYIRTISTFIAYGTTGRTPTLVLNASGSENNNATSGNANNLNIDIEPINFDTFFGFPDAIFNDGLTKQEINRHTISYEYKPCLSTKRKRVKMEELETPAPSTSTATSTNENCSICLDRFNQNVQVR